MRQRLSRTQNSTRRSYRTGRTSVGLVGQMRPLLRPVCREISEAE